MSPEHTSIETITAEVGRWSVDVAAGWETGMLGRQRIRGTLYQRHAPEHLMEPKNELRLKDWLAGRDGASRYRKRALFREVHFVASNKDGQLSVVRKGWSVRRGDVVTQLEDKGCFGDVYVFYYEGGKLARTVMCGI